MTRNVLVLVVSLVALVGCSGPLQQNTRTVVTAPISEQYQLTKRPEGKIYVLLGEVSTGQEQYRHAVADSLTTTIQEPASTEGLFPLLPLKAAVLEQDETGISPTIYSFSDFSNKLNEKDLAQLYAETKAFYERNGLFRKQDLAALGKAIEADYFFLPRVYEVRRRQNSRFSAFGLKVLHTQVTCVVVGLEIWHAPTGRKVFSATSDATVASERIEERPISVEKVFAQAWKGIMKRLPQ